MPSITHERNGHTFSVDHALVTTSCWCGIKFAIPDNLYRWLQDDATRDCYCPMGHTFVYTKGAAAIAQERLAEEERRRRMAQERADRERERADDNERRRIAQKAATTRAKKRHGAAVCPCCKRSFKQLRRHMQTQHPDFDPGAES